MNLTVACLLASAALQDPGARGGYPDLQPTSYRSPSGEWEVFVDPGSPDGAGPAQYEILREGETVWSGQHRTTYWQMMLSDEGTGLGFGYSDGVNTWSGRLIVAMLTPDGTMRTLESRLRGPSRFAEFVATPNGMDLLQHVQMGAVVVVVGDRETMRRGLEWRFFDARTGRLHQSIRPKEYQVDPSALGNYLGAETIDRFPLFLVHWAGNFSEDPVRFSLIDTSGRSVWYIDREDELPGLVRQGRRIGATGFLLESANPRTFALWFRKEGLRVRYGIERIGGIWSVTELDRTPLEVPLPLPLDEGPAFEEILPVHVGSIDVSVPDPSVPAVQNVGPFTIDDDGQLAFLPADQRELPVHLTLVDVDGELVERIALDPLVTGTGEWVDLDWDDTAGRFLLVRRTGSGGELWSLDPGSKEARQVSLGDLPGLVGVQMLTDGGFLARHGRAVSCYDASENKRWQTRGRAMAGMGRDRIAVLDHDGRAIQLHDYAGDSVGSIDLSVVRLGDPGAGTRFEPDVADGLIFIDSGRRIVRFRADGSVRSIFQPGYENGRRFRVAETVQVGPQARLWTSDRSTLLRLDADGAVDRRLGLGSGVNVGDSETVALGPGGQIYAVGRDRGVVRVHDPLGHHLFNCDPSAIETSHDPSLQKVTVSVETDGSTLLSGREGVFLFSPEGRLARIEERGFDPIRETWYASRRPGERLIVGQRRAFLVDAEGEVRHEIERRPDGRWLKNLYQASVAPDGSFALLAGGGLEERMSTPPAVFIFSAAGEPLRTIRIPVASETLPHMAYDGLRLVYVDECVALVFDHLGEPIGRFTLPGEPGLDHWQPLLPEHVEELWAFDLKHTIERYELP